MTHDASLLAMIVSVPHCQSNLDLLWNNHDILMERVPKKKIRDMRHKIVNVPVRSKKLAIHTGE